MTPEKLLECDRLNYALLETCCVKSRTVEIYPVERPLRVILKDGPILGSEVLAARLVFHRNAGLSGLRNAVRLENRKGDLLADIDIDMAASVTVSGLVRMVDKYGSAPAQFFNRTKRKA